ncbi:MAG: RNA-binding protein [Ignavibacteria bacterium GWF2_33_9]|nr:MAG: RNA-binding protein [Ignavibacteria bacterium GWF2_33_9]
MNIYVGNLPFSATDESLKEIFTEYGQVQSAKVIVDRETGRSKGFGFVEMSDNAARKAITELNETEYEGKQITVNEARPKENNRNSNRNNNSRRPW